MAEGAALFESLFQQSPTAFEVCSVDGRCLFVNEAFRKLFGGDPAPDTNAFAGDAFQKLSSPDALQRALAGETVRGERLWYDRQLPPGDETSGRRIGVQMTLLPVRGPAGPVGHVALSFKDVTAELETRETNEARNAAILEAALDCIVMMDHRGHILEFNPAAERTFGYARADVIGRRLADLLIPPSLREAHTQGFQRYLATGEGPILGRRVEVSAQRADGTEFLAEVAVVRIRADGPPMFTGYIRDITEQRRTADALRSSEARFKRLADSGILGIVVAGVRGPIQEANDAFLSMVGYTRSDLESGQLRPPEMTPAEWHATDENARASLMTTGVTAAREKEYFRKDGSRVPILAGSAMLEGSDGRCVSFILDLTGRKRAEEALLRSERRFRRLVDSGIIGIVLSDMRGTVHEANDAFLALVGYSRDDFVSGRLGGDTLNTPERMKTDAIARAQLEANGIAQPWEKELRHKDGRRIPVLMGVAMLDPPNSIAFVVDLTQRKRDEDAIRQLREQGERDAAFRGLLHAAPDAMVVADDRGGIIFVNVQTERLFDYRGDEIVGQPVDLLLPARLRAKSAVDTLRALAGGATLEVSGRRNDDSEFPAEISLSPFETPAGRVTIIAIRDVSERKRAQDQLREANTRLTAVIEDLRRSKEATENANRDLEAFSYSVAHDLRTPLRAINGLSSTVLEDYGDRLDDEARRRLKRVVGGAERMGQIIHALLSLARLTRVELHKERVNLGALARGIVDQLVASEPGRPLDFVVDADVTAYGDAQFLRSLMENLLDNAWKFTRGTTRPRIEVGQQAHNGEVAYFIRDNGAGFDMVYVAKLFTPFERLHPTSDFEGTGVGLATVQRIVARHGGRVWAEGAEGHGATFYFTLPPRSP